MGGREKILQTSYYLREKLDGWLFSQYKSGYNNVLVLWTGTNDFALSDANLVQAVYGDLVAMAQIAHAAGWRVVVITVNRLGSPRAPEPLSRAAPSAVAESPRITS